MLAAAEVLSARFQENGSFIQAWGHYGDPKEYRLIIDSLMNLPLLFEATKLSGNRVYEEIASRHYHTLMKTVIKSDATTYHTYYFDPETGKQNMELRIKDIVILPFGHEAKVGQF